MQIHPFGAIITVLPRGARGVAVPAVVKETRLPSDGPDGGYHVMLLNGSEASYAWDELAPAALALPTVRVDIEEELYSYELAATGMVQGTVLEPLGARLGAVLHACGARAAGSRAGSLYAEFSVLDIPALELLQQTIEYLDPAAGAQAIKRRAIAATARARQECTAKLAEWNNRVPHLVLLSA